MDTTIFTETQHFEFYHVLIIAAVGALVFFCMFKFRDKGGKPMNTLIGKAVIYTLAALPIPIAILFWIMALQTNINDSGIAVKFYPFHQEWRMYEWKDIKSCKVKKYHPVHDYGGYGVRGKAYNISGDMGLFIRFNNGSHFLIGTQKPEELEKALIMAGRIKAEDKFVSE